MKKVRFGILRETKTPLDNRAPLAPEHCRQLLDQYTNLEIYIQPAKHRCFPSQAYAAEGVRLREELNNCDYLLGVKEVAISSLLYNKTYLFFSHTAKMQPHNRELLRNILIRRITLIDYEYLTDEQGRRLVGFGRFAGIVGAHNALWIWGRRTGQYELPRAYQVKTYDALKEAYRQVEIPPVKVIVTGRGRSAGGAMELLKVAGFKQVDKETFLNTSSPTEPIFVQLTKADIYRHKEKGTYDKADFEAHPQAYEPVIAPFLASANILVNCLNWDYSMPPLFKAEDTKDPERFKIKVIADVSCDIKGSVPITLRATTIENPVYGYDPIKEIITQPFGENVIDVMAVDNLPSELPCDATREFGKDLSEKVLPLLIEEPDHPIIQRATIVRKGQLTERFKYLEDFVRGRTKAHD